MENFSKICRDFMNSRNPNKQHKGCSRDNCKFIHDENLCYFFYKGDCKKGDTCNFNHFTEISYNINNNDNKNYKKNKHAKNTESFEPNYTPPDMRILYDCSTEKCNLNIQTQDIIIAPNLFCDQNNFDIYNKLIEEMEKCGINQDKLWKLWHGDTHLIADDHLNWSKKNVPTFNMIVDKISKFFNMDIKATRFNFYRDNNDWKPFHHDAAAVKPDKAKTQNFTVGISFGSMRDIAFEDALEPNGHRRIISVPLPNGSTYCFTRDININWKHGLLPIDPNKNIPDKLGRISIIAWGYVNQQEVK